MLNFLFWNIKQKPIAPLISQLARERRVDILVLAECTIDPMVLLGELNQHGTDDFLFSDGFSVTDKFYVYTRFDHSWLQPVYDLRTLGISIRRLEHPLYDDDVILGMVHLPSKLYLSEDNQSQLATRFREPIEDVENELGHSRTILFGDFNMNPFEKGMISSESFHAITDQVKAADIDRTVYDEIRKFFYNPMWSLMGDISRGPPGTYYYNRSDPITYFWNTLDQVILRPSLISSFVSDRLAIVTSIGDESLARKNGRPDSAKASDHLPLFFSLNLPLRGET